MQRLRVNRVTPGSPPRYDMDERTARIQALWANISRYPLLLASQLAEDEREFIHTRFAEGRLALDGLYAAPPVRDFARPTRPRRRREYLPVFQRKKPGTHAGL